MQEEDENSHNTFQIYFGKDGPKNTLLHHRKDKSGTKQDVILIVISWTLAEQHEGRMCFNGLIYSVDKTLPCGAAELELLLNPLLDFSFLDRQ